MNSDEGPRDLVGGLFMGIPQPGEDPLHGMLRAINETIDENDGWDIIGTFYALSLLDGVGIQCERVNPLCNSIGPNLSDFLPLTVRLLKDDRNSPLPLKPMLAKMLPENFYGLVMFGEAWAVPLPDNIEDHPARLAEIAATGGVAAQEERVEIRFGYAFTMDERLVKLEQERETGMIHISDMAHVDGEAVMESGRILNAFTEFTKICGALAPSCKVMR